MNYPRFMVGQLFIIEGLLTSGWLSTALTILGVLYCLAAIITINRKPKL